MQIFVRVMLGRTITLDVEPNESVESVKEKIWAREGVPVEAQRLFYGGKFLAPGGLLSDFGIQDEVTLNLGFSSVAPKVNVTQKKIDVKNNYNYFDQSAAKRRCVQV